LLEKMKFSLSQLWMTSLKNGIYQFVIISTSCIMFLI
jgi:hypothetical protein